MASYPVSSISHSPTTTLVLPLGNNHSPDFHNNYFFDFLYDFSTYTCILKQCSLISLFGILSDYKNVCSILTAFVTPYYVCEICPQLQLILSLLFSTVFQCIEITQFPYPLCCGQIMNCSQVLPCKQCCYDCSCVSILMLISHHLSKGMYVL